MDSNITVRFYRVESKGAEQPKFGDLLEALLLTDESKLVAILGGAVPIQLERFSKDAQSGMICGDLVRRQTENLPSLSVDGKPTAKLPLPAGAGLGHHAGFLFDPQTGMLAFQFTRNAVSLTRFNLFLSELGKCETFNFLPVLNIAELQRLASISPRTLTIKIADPDGLEAIEDSQSSLRASISNLKGISNGAYVRVQMGIGHAKGELDKGRLISIITWLMGQRVKKRGKVQIINVVGKADDLEEDVELDFLKGRLEETQTLSFVGTGPDENFVEREKFLRHAMLKNKETLKKFQKNIQ